MTEIWADDRLGRSADADYIITFLGRRLEERRAAGLPTSYVLNVDAPWGTGKTFFMTNLAEQLREAGHVVAKVDAWATDHADDPLLAVMAAIEDAVSPLLAKPKAKVVGDTLKNLSRNAGTIAVAAAKGAAMQGLRKVIGGVVDDLPALIDGPKNKGETSVTADMAESAATAATEAAISKIQTLLDEQATAHVDGFRRGQASIAAFKRDLNKLTGQLEANGKAPPLYVLVDELDRCRPNYAISLLERAKHLFDVDGVVFVIATDTTQLSRAIKAIYGGEFDSFAYLHRFFDRTYQFDDPALDAFVDQMVALDPIDKKLLSLPPAQTLSGTLAHIFEAYGTSPRDMHRIYDLLRTVASTWTYKHAIEVTAMVPMAIAMQRGILQTTNPLVVGDWTMQTSRTTRPLTWKFSDRRSSNETAEFSIGKAMPAWVQMASQDLPSIFSRDNDGDAIRAWIAGTLGREFGLVHNNTHSGRGGPYSVVRDYPAILRKAGRFSA